MSYSVYVCLFRDGVFVFSPLFFLFLSSLFLPPRSVCDWQKSFRASRSIPSLASLEPPTHWPWAARLSASHILTASWPFSGLSGPDRKSFLTRVGGGVRGEVRVRDVYGVCAGRGFCGLEGTRQYLVVVTGVGGEGVVLIVGYGLGEAESLLATA